MIREKDLISIEDLLKHNNLTIPVYQRPYKWTAKNVHALIDDILFFKDKSEYRLGTLILYSKKENPDDPTKNGNNTEKLEIVDGQQRTVTFLLIAKALKEKDKGKDYPEIKIDGKFYSWEFRNPISQRNICRNYQEIRQRVQEFDGESVDFFLKKCKLVKIVLDDLSEAFQFFDSQNARGKDLDPHDLLKASHLREMNHLPEEVKKKTVEEWEKIPSRKLKDLFGNYLFRIRNWGKGRSARYFTKNEVDMFKGITLEKEDGQASTPPYARPYQIVDTFVDEISRVFMVDYPFQLDQVILNGKRFFEMVAHYGSLVEKITSDDSKKIVEFLGLEDNDVGVTILKTINGYEGMYRTGDRYVRNLFDCALLYYWDRFGPMELNRAIQKIFLWAYRVRLEKRAVHLSSVDNHAIETALFKRISEALSHKEVVNMRVDILEEVRSTQTGKIEDK